MKRVAFLAVLVPLLLVSCGIARSAKSIQTANDLNRKAVSSLARYVGNDSIIAGDDKRPTIKNSAFTLVKDLDKRPVFVSYYKGRVLLKEAYYFASAGQYDQAVLAGNLASKEFRTVLKKTAHASVGSTVTVPKNPVVTPVPAGKKGKPAPQTTPKNAPAPKAAPAPAAKKVVPAPQTTPKTTTAAKPASAPKAAPAPAAKKVVPAPQTTPKTTPVVKPAPKAAPAPAVKKVAPVSQTTPKTTTAAKPVSAPAAKPVPKATPAPAARPAPKTEKKPEKKTDKKKEEPKGKEKKKKEEVDYFKLYQKYRTKGTETGGDK